MFIIHEALPLFIPATPAFIIIIFYFLYFLFTLATFQAKNLAGIAAGVDTVRPADTRKQLLLLLTAWLLPRKSVIDLLIMRIEFFCQSISVLLGLVHNFSNPLR